MDQRTTVAIVGATGYTGAELVRLLAGHPRLQITEIVGHSRAGENVGAALPHLSGQVDGEIGAFDADRIARRATVAFCALPHGASAVAVAALRSRSVRVLDLSADFRLKDRAIYEQWYGKHPEWDVARTAAYGLVELHREEIRQADLIAVPGCYPTASILALAPLLRNGLVSTDGIVIDAKSGVSGAGRTATSSTHLPETAEGIRAYKAAGLHRHTPEIEQELGVASGNAIRVTFTPHLAPMTRGILATCYARSNPGVTSEMCTKAARDLYAGSKSVHVMDPGSHPDTLWVRGSNRAMISYAVDSRTGLVVVQSVIDNLVKGAAGQAVQCLNVRLGFDEEDGLASAAVWP